MSDSSPRLQAAANEAPEHPRRVRSYVLRGGRLTDGQKRALDELWPRFGLAGEGPVDLGRVFGNDHPVVLEIGFGNGEATWRMAKAYPDQNFLAIEVHRPGIGRLLLELDKRGLDNVRVVEGDAVEFLRARTAPGALDGVRIYFPDPWPKKRHHKRRLVQPEFLDLLASRMRPAAFCTWQPTGPHTRST